MDLEAKMALAMSYLKGLVFFSEFSRDSVNLSTGNFYYEKEDMTVRNEYDEKGRITRQKFPDKGKMCYAYDDKKNTTTLTERNGSVITYVKA